MSNSPEKPNRLTRRHFIRKSAELGAYLATLSSGVGMLSACSTGRAVRSTASVTGSEDEFEYIVVGSGGGGGPVAANLAKAGFSVLLLEAGGKDEILKSQIPVLHAMATEDPAIAWNFFVQHYGDPKREALGSKYVANKGGILYPRGGTLGGSTAMNALVTLCPPNSDWDQIASLTGDRSWNSDDMRSYFQKVERAHYMNPLDGIEKANIGRRGVDGWLMTEQSDISIALKDKKLLALIVAAARTQGIGREIIDKLVKEDFNMRWDPNDWESLSKSMEGMFLIPKATNHGKRNGTRELVLNTLSSHPDQLKLRTGALATRVLFDDNKKTRAIGVEYLEGAHLYRADPNAASAPGVKRQVFAKKEVILAGGAFNSPQLLMLSGIGPREVLERNRIPVRIPMPGVGQNLQDRYEVGVVQELKSDFSALEQCTWGQKGDPCLSDWETDRMKSLYSSNGVVVSLLKRSSPDKAEPDLVLFGIPGDFRGYVPGWSETCFAKNRFTWAILKGHTKNTAGSVALKSADPLDTPEIRFRYFDEGNDSSGDDLEAVLKGVKIARSINRDLFVRSLMSAEVAPGSQFAEDDHLREFIKREAWGHHASCTNKIGPASDFMAVVDSKFRVHGTQGLRVVDASVFPKIPGLFIAVPVYIVAEKASADILADSSKPV